MQAFWNTVFLATMCSNHPTLNDNVIAERTVVDEVSLPVRHRVPCIIQCSMTGEQYITRVSIEGDGSFDPGLQ